MKITLFLTILLFSKSVLGIGRVVAYEEVASNLFDSIQSIKTCGSWNINDEFGEFRVIEIFYAGQDMLFIDMVKINNGTELKVVQGFSFSEINNDHSEIGLDNISCTEIEKNKIQVEGTAESMHNATPYKFTVVVDGKSKSYKYTKYPVNNSKD